MGTIQYSPSASSLTEVPVAPFMLSSSNAMVPTLSLPKGQAEFVGSKLDLHITRDWPYGSSLSSSAGLTFSGTGPFLLSSIQLSSQGSAPNIGRSTGQDGETS